MKKESKFILFLFIIFFFPFFAFAKEKKVTLYFFHGNGCPHCAEEEVFLKGIEKKYKNLEIVEYEVWYDRENAELLKKVEKAFGITRTGVPTNIIGKTVIMGFGDTTGPRLERAIVYYLENDYVDVVPQIFEGSLESVETLGEDEFTVQEIESDEELTIDVPTIGDINLKKVSLMTAAVIIGLVDGFNPCAMWILLFLISILIGMKDRKRMWALGLTFLITSALVYMLIMLSWIQIAVRITTIIWVRNAIAVVALAGGIWNLRSYFTTQDSGCEVVDDKKRKNIFQKIRKFTGEKSFLLALLGVMGLAVSVNLVELACSAGLPLVFTELLVLNHVSNFMKFMYTVLYILFFLLDDLIVFFIAMFTMKVTGISTKYNKYSHLIGGIIMVLIGVLLLIHPEWLMFQFK